MSVSYTAFLNMETGNNMARRSLNFCFGIPFDGPRCLPTAFTCRVL